MKKTKLWFGLFLTLVLSLCLGVFAACGSDESGTSGGDEQNGTSGDSSTTVEEMLTFSATSDVTVSEVTYSLTATLYTDNTLKLVSAPDTGDALTISGTWAEDTYNGKTGYGYVLTFNDGTSGGKTIHANFDQERAKHYFYYYMTTLGGSTSFDTTQVCFEVLDSGYFKTLASDYAIYEEREAAYHFQDAGIADSSTGNVQTVDLYCVSDGSAAVVQYSSGTTTYYGNGTWTYDSNTDVITVEINGETMVSQKCDETGKVGYRLFWSNYSAYVYIITDSNVAANFYVSDYTDEDFVGTTLFTLTKITTETAEDGTVTTSYGSDTIQITSKGYAILAVQTQSMFSTSTSYTNGTWAATGEVSETTDDDGTETTFICELDAAVSEEDAGTYYVTLDGLTYLMDYDATTGTYSITIRMEESSSSGGGFDWGDFDFGGFDFGF